VFSPSCSGTFKARAFALNPIAAGRKALLGTPTRYICTSEATNITWDSHLEGNYWSDYTGADSDGDGIGDIPYVIDENNRDHFPLMKVGWNPGWNPGDIDYDLDVDIFDLVRCAAAYGVTPTDADWDPPCDVAAPYEIINIFDIVTVAVSYGEEYTP
jgi:hypothetical protein